MNQPIEQRIKKIEDRLDKIEQQQTEPIKVTIERRQTEAERILDNHTEILREQEELLTKIYTVVGTQAADIGVLKHEMKGARADILAIKATQSDHGELLAGLKATQSEHSKRFNRLETIMMQILDRLLQPKGE